MMEDHPFQPGVEVAVVTRSPYYGTSYNLAKVAKVYKSGRFILEDSNQQYRASRDVYNKEWRATATGEDGYRSNRVELVTDKLREEVAASDRGKRFRKIINCFDKEVTKLSARVTAEHIADFERIYAELTAKGSE